MTTLQANTEVKDRVFKFIFQKPKFALQLFNALNNTNYQDPSKLQINSLGNTLFYSLENDVSFIIDDRLSLFEQQSTLNNNMPLRFLEYIAELYGKYLGNQSRKKYGSKRIMLPAPTFTVFYNGPQEAPEKEIMKLSSSFLGLKEDEEPSLELVVRWYNVNDRKNHELLDKCPPLSEYAWMSDNITTYRREGYDITESVTRMFEDMPKDFGIYQDIMNEKSQVMNMFRTEFNEKEFFEVAKEEGFAEGEERGKNEKAIEIAKKMLLKNVPIEDIAGYTDLSFEDIKSLINK